VSVTWNAAGLFLAVLLAIPCVVHARESDGRPTGSRVSAALTAAWQADAPLDSGGDMAVSRYLFSLGVERDVTPPFSLGLHGRYHLNDYDFSGDRGLGGLRPWDQVHALGVDVSGTYRFADTWSLGLRPTVGWSGAEGADWSESAVYGLAVSLTKQLRPGLFLGAGLGVYAGLEEEKVFPLLVVIWNINERLRLSNPFGQGPGSPAGLTLACDFGADLEGAIGAAWRSERFRLAKGDVIAKGIGEVEGVPVWLRLTRRLKTGIALDLWLGAVLAGDVTLEDRSGRRVTSDQHDPAFLGALTFSMRR
jgi:hypothetical protein